MVEATATRLLVIRHGESNATVEGFLGGVDTCTGLSDLGRRQAERLRDRFRAGHEPAIDEVWASAVPRAIETAEIVNQTLDLELQIDNEFEEFRPGSADGMKFAEYVATHGMPDQMAEPYRRLAEGGDSRATFFLRVGEATDRLVAKRAGRTIALFCHGGVVDVIFRRLLGLHSEAPFELHTTNTSITEFVTVRHDPPRRWRLARYDDRAHLAGLPDATPRSA